MLEGLENVIERIGTIQQRVSRMTEMQKKLHGTFESKVKQAAVPEEPQIETEGSDASWIKDAHFNAASAITGKTYSENAFDSLIKDSAERFKLPPALIKAVMKQESNFNPRAVSTAGASGLMQLMPQTAKMLNVSSIFDPEQNVRGGSQYLRDMIDRYQGDLTKALAAYNAGPGNVDRYGGVPDFPETQNYVRKVLQYYSDFS